MSMATGTTYTDREFLFRLQTEIIDGGTDVLRNIFDQKIQNTSLTVFLANEKTSITRLRGQKAITNTQYGHLYPPGGQPPNSANFDITLIICLLRNLKSLGLNRNFFWNATPQPTDKSLEADLCRLKGFRNEIAHISSTVGFHQASFLTKWTDIEQVLLRLNSAVPNPVHDLKQILDSYKHNPLDPAAEKRIQADIANWRKMEKALEVEMELMKNDVKGLQKDVKDISKDVEEMKKCVEKATDGVEEVKENLRRFEERVEVKVAKEPNIQDLQDDLISFYRDKHCTISLSPLISEETSYLKFFVMPEIYSLRLQPTGGNQAKTAVTPLRNMFYNDDKMCRKIYLTADAGLGKTALSKQLTLAWCQANKPHEDEAQYFSPEEIQAVNEFRFVFLLLLRDSSSKCEIDDLIWNQIFTKLGRQYPPTLVENILTEERCLIILDGLDEWSHPSHSCEQELKSIPHQKVREHTVVLTTTRPWKLSVSRLPSSQIDRKLKLVGLNQESANVLKRLVISHLKNEKNENKIRHKVEAFTRAVKEKKIQDLEEIPLLLMYLLYLWCNKIELGQSRCDLYSQITELVLSITAKNEKPPRVDPFKGDTPQVLSDKTHCLHFYTLLTALGQLAYQTLFKDTRENTLVFDGCVADQYLNKESFNFCLKAGLITQSKIPGPETLLQHKSKVSFAHKTVQEFFAALYIHSNSNRTSVPEIVTSKCKCIKDILEMSKILIFSCGMNVNVLSLILHEMMNIINTDEITREYRCKVENDYSDPLKDFQDMLISCCKEIPRESEISLCLQDVFIENSCNQKQYRENLKTLVSRNKRNIRSLQINMCEMRDTPYRSAEEVVEYFALNDLENIEVVHYIYKSRDSGILSLNRSIKCLHFSCYWRGSLSRLLCEKMTSLQKLEAIHINRFKMSHRELTLLYDFISKRHCMRQIELDDLFCNDHGLYSCTECRLDLSQHSQLYKLTLDEMPLSELNINTAPLEECCLRILNLKSLDVILRFINCVPGNSKLNSCEYRKLESRVKHVELSSIDLGNREVLTSDMVNIELVRLVDVTMTASVLQGIVDVVQKQPQTVTVVIEDCDIKPESEFETVKQNICSSLRHFNVLSNYETWFKFETKTQTL